MGAAQDAVSEEAVTFAGYRTGITAEAELREGVMVKLHPPPPGWTENARLRSELLGGKYVDVERPV